VYLCSLLNAANPLNISVVTAEFQTAGKGQQGNSWHSERGKNLLFSHAVFPEKLAAAEQFILSQIVALALCKTLLSFGIDACIKWANDIYVGDKKIAGVLIENQLLGALLKTGIIGIGLNVNQTEFPPFLPNPTSMALCAQQSFDKDEVLERYLRNFDELFQTIDDISVRTAIRSEYLSKLYRHNIFSRFADANGEFEGSIIDVEQDGKLVIQTSISNVRSYYFKEVRFLL
jgi:BirA family biotin operon repressor/biotin-[acetyl-CoA-carboxylase] ligase